MMDLDFNQIRNLDKSSELIIVDGIKIINDMKTNYFNTVLTNTPKIFDEQFDIFKSNGNVNVNGNAVKNAIGIDNENGHGIESGNRNDNENGLENGIENENGHSHYEYVYRNKPRHRYESSHCTWTKITTTNKYKLINTFIDSLNINDKRMKANVLYLLTSAIDQHKITKNVDVNYDVVSKTLKGIYKLYMDNGDYKLSETNLLDDYIRIIE